MLKYEKLIAHLSENDQTRLGLVQRIKKGDESASFVLRAQRENGHVGEDDGVLCASKNQLMSCAEREKDSQSCCLW